MNNVNIKEEGNKAYAQHPMYNAHQKILSQQSAEELHTALKSCNELGQAKTLEQFLLDLQKIEGSHVPSQKSVQRIKNDRAFRNFLSRVIVCTEPGYVPSQLETIAREPPKSEYAERYMDLISDIIKELLREGKSNKLQTFGYSLEGDGSVSVNNNAQGPAADVNMAGAHNDSVKVNFINLNKQCMITRNWE